MNNNRIEIQLYSDEGLTITKEYFFDESANMTGIAAIIEQQGIIHVIDKKLGFLDWGIALKITDPRKAIISQPDAFIEVYSTGRPIWNNRQSN